MDMSLLTVVIADDHRTSREIVVSALRSVGVRNIFQAEDGGKAFNLICDRQPDVAFLDLEMPHDGIRVLRAVRRSPQSPNFRLPVIVMTAQADKPTIMMVRDAGATEIISKPLTLEKICSRVKAVFARPRPFVVCDAYIGPCRRRASGEGYFGPLRRGTDSPIEEIDIA